MISRRRLGIGTVALAALAVTAIVVGNTSDEELEPRPRATLSERRERLGQLGGKLTGWCASEAAESKLRRRPSAATDAALAEFARIAQQDPAIAQPRIEVVIATHPDCSLVPRLRPLLR
jgi:hypothetical protein